MPEGTKHKKRHGGSPEYTPSLEQIEKEKIAIRLKHQQNQTKSGRVNRKHTEDDYIPRIYKTHIRVTQELY